ncbi:hypothetical protein BH09PLA1_BH09PLA1_00670 [soil metagenome]
MSQANPITCPFCNRQYNWKPDLAGRRVKCKCGNAIAVPVAEAEAQAADDTYDVGGIDLSDLPPPPTDSGYRCPSCRNPMEPGTRQCPNCGFDVKSGKTGGATSKVSGTAAAAAAAPRAIGYAGGKRADAAKAMEQRNLIKQAILFVAAIVLVGGAIFAMRFLSGGKAAKTGLGEDDDVIAMISDENGTEARKWIEGHPGRMLGGTTRSQAEYKIDQWYKMGATKVIAFGGVMSMTVALELPSDLEKRKELFAWEKKWHSEMDRKPAVDVGQKYLLIRMRL